MRRQPVEDLTADGIATRNVRNEKIAAGQLDWPLTNMWWPQTRKPTSAMATRGERDGPVAEDRLAARTSAMSSRDDRHAGQNHDVHGRVRIEPEEVLEQHRIAAELRVEDADVERALHDQQQQRDAEHRRGQDLDERGGVDAPRRTAASGTSPCRARAACEPWR